MNMKKMAITAALGLLLTGTATANAYESRLQPFRDVGETVWSAEHIYTLAAIQALDGYEDGTFHPLAQMSREEFIKLLTASVSASYDKNGQEVKLNDVAGNRWSYPMIAAALQQHWIDALVDQDSRFTPTASIRREEVAYAMGSMLINRLTEPERKQWLEGGWQKERDRAAFPDSAAVDKSLEPYVYYAVNRGILEGNERGFDPKSPLSRQEAAAVIDRLLHQEVTGKPLAITGFYAIQSFGSLGKMPLLDQVALGWWHLDYEGPGKASLGSTGDPFKFNLPDGWQQVTDAAEKSGVGKELTVFANGSHHVEEFLGDSAARQAFLDSLETMLHDPKFGFSGLCIDFEDLYTADKRDAFSSFLAELKGVLKGKTLSVAVPPTYYYKGYDLKTIGETADTVILMAYNFLHKPDRLPSAPFPLVAEAVRDTLNAGVPANKLVLGIGKKTDQFIAQDGSTLYASPTSEMVEERLKKQGVLKSLSVPYLLEHIQYTDGGDHELFYEDAASIDRKLWLARYYGLKGAALWYMGQFVESDWERIAAVE